MKLIENVTIIETDIIKVNRNNFRIFDYILKENLLNHLVCNNVHVNFRKQILQSCIFYNNILHTAELIPILNYDKNELLDLIKNLENNSLYKNKFFRLNCAKILHILYNVGLIDRTDYDLYFNKFLNIIDYEWYVNNILNNNISQYSGSYPFINMIKSYLNNRDKKKLDNV